MFIDTSEIIIFVACFVIGFLTHMMIDCFKRDDDHKEDQPDFDPINPLNRRCKKLSEFDYSYTDENGKTWYKAVPNGEVYHEER